MTAATRALVLAIVSVVALPFLVFVEVVAFLLAGMVTYEPSNPAIVKIASVVVFILIGVVALALPAIAFLTGGRARRVIRASGTDAPGVGKAVTAQVVAGIVVLAVAAVQVYLVLMALGVCSLEGC